MRWCSNCTRSRRRRTKVVGHQFELVEAKMKTASKPHVKREQARLGQAGTQLQNATATVYGQKKPLEASQQVHASTEKVETVDATAERTDDKVGPRNSRCGRRSSKTARVFCHRISHRWMKMTVWVQTLQNKKVQKK